jgi:hypothetical protein
MKMMSSCGSVGRWAIWQSPASKVGTIPAISAVVMAANAVWLLESPSHPETLLARFGASSGASGFCLDHVYAAYRRPFLAMGVVDMGCARDALYRGNLAASVDAARRVAI